MNFKKSKFDNRFSRGASLKGADEYYSDYETADCGDKKTGLKDNLKKNLFNENCFVKTETIGIRI